jgi:hypothetical protein
LTFLHGGRHIPLLFWRSWWVHWFLIYLRSHCQSGHRGSLIQPLDRLLMGRVAPWTPLGAKATSLRNILDAPYIEWVSPALTSFWVPPDLVSVVYIFFDKINFCRPSCVSTLKRIEFFYLLKRLCRGLNLAKLWILWSLDLSIGPLCGIERNLRLRDNLHTIKFGISLSCLQSAGDLELWWPKLLHIDSLSIRA